MLNVGNIFRSYFFQQQKIKCLVNLAQYDHIKLDGNKINFYRRGESIWGSAHYQINFNKEEDAIKEFEDLETILGTHIDNKKDTNDKQ